MTTHDRPILTAATDAGDTWPVIDITHPAFAREPTDAELETIDAAFLADAAKRARIPLFVQRLVMRVALRRTLLGPGLLSASGGFVSGLNTYLIKLGPDNLPAGAGPIDRRIAETFPAVSARLRLMDMARLMAEDLAGRLAPGDGRPLVFVNIAGGPSSDSLNAVLLLQRDRPDLIDGRSIDVRVLDRDGHGPSFAVRCAAALASTGGPLAGLDLHVHPVSSDWSDTHVLRESLAAAAAGNAVVSVSSEGGLFEYGTDADIAANLEAIRDAAPAGTRIAASVTRGDGAAGAAHKAADIRVRPHTMEEFERLAARAGWSVERTIVRPFSFDVRLARQS